MEDQLKREIDTLMRANCATDCASKFATQRDLDKLQEFVETRGSDKTMNLFIRLVVMVIALLVGGGLSSYLGYAKVQTDIVQMRTEAKAVLERQKENTELLKQIDQLLRQAP